LITDEVIGAEFDSGLCNYCREDKPLITGKMREKGLKNFNQTIKDIKKHKGPYNCIVACSGGKDSAYLLYLMKEEYGLKPLAVTVDTGFLSETAKENIAELSKKLSIDHIYIQPEKDIYHSVYRHYLKNYDDTKLIMYTVCRHCTDIMDMLMARVAIEKKIPVVFVGISPDEYRTCINMFETDKFFYEPPKDVLMKEFNTKVFKGIINKDILKKIDVTETKQGFPRFIYPLHVLPYDIKKVIRLLHKKKLMPKGKSTPYKTNCLLNWVMIYSFMKKKGYNPYLEMFSDAVRKDPSLRARYVVLDNIMKILVKMNMFQSKNIKNILDELDLKEKDIL